MSRIAPQYGVVKLGQDDYFSQSPLKTQSEPPPSKDDDLDHSNDELDDEEVIYQPKGLIRLREESGAVTPSRSHMHRKSGHDIARFTDESLHSFGFTPPCRDQNMFEARRNVVNRSLDFMKKLKDKVDMTKLEPYAGTLVTDTFAKPIIDLKHEALQSSTFSRNHRRQTAVPYSEASQHVLENILTNRRASIDVNAHLDSTSQSHCQVHPPTRFLPQNQSIITTNEVGKILLFNDIASLCFGYDKSYVGQSILNVFEENTKVKLESLLESRIAELDHETEQERGTVLICGKVLPIIRRNGTKTAASLWLKQKWDIPGNTIYIWIFEEIAESLVTMQLTSTGDIMKVTGAINDLYGYSEENLIGKKIDTLIPACSKLRSGDSGYYDNKDAPAVNFNEMNKFKFYGSCTSFGARFPVIVKAKPSETPSSPNGLSMFDLKIVSIPTIAGLVNVRLDGSIHSINSVPAKYLFGYNPEVLVDKKNMDELLPQWSKIFKGLEKGNLLRKSSITDYPSCRRILLDQETSTRVTKVGSTQQTNVPHNRKPTTVLDRQLPVIHAIHRDGTRFEVQIQLRMMEIAEEELIALWITFDRVSTFSKYGHMNKVAANNVQLASPISNYPRMRTSISTPSESALLTTDGHKKDLDSSFSSKPIVPVQVESAATLQSPSPEQSIAVPRPGPRSFGVSSFGSANIDKKVLPVQGSMLVSPHPSVEMVKAAPSPSPPPKPFRLPSNVMPMTPPPARTPPISLLNYSALTRKTTISDYCILDSLGQGAYGMVKLAYRLDDPEKKKVVIKYVVKSRILVDSWIRDRHLRMVPLEIHILHTLRRIPHVNCCHMFDYFEDDDYYYIVMDLHGEGLDLFDYIELNRNMSEQEVKSIFRQIAEAVRHLHHNKMVHRDIKDENVILDENGTALLIDFGSANYVKEGKRFDTFSGTLDYCAPEVLQGQPYEGPPQDIWSLGILLYTMVFKENPFYNIDEILARELRIPYDFCEGAIDLIKSMLNREVDKRPTIDSVLNHAWLS
ncbi:hypothetical protein NQZ79_g3523 [Umbelopsis isabellina]|nr:hypothetical protein NQZ79_g3523 [Umbelopsis isabellina]